MEKWKRIIEPAGDSESSDWSSEDSTASHVISPFRLRTYFNTRHRNHPQEGMPSSQSQVDDPVEDCWQEFPPDYRTPSKKRCITGVAQVNVNCSTSVVTRDASNEASSSIEAEKDRADLYGSGSRSWSMDGEDNFTTYRKLSRYKTKFFNGASTSYQVSEPGCHTAIANSSPTRSTSIEGRSKSFSSQESRERLKRPESDGQLTREPEENETTNDKINETLASPHTRVVNSNNNPGDNAVDEATDDNKDTPNEDQSSIIAVEESTQQRDIVDPSNMDLNQSLISLLECPVCLEYVSPPINQCKRGHLVCANCKPQLNNCPTCRSRFTETRNLAMEQVAEKLYYPCRNHTSGCKGLYLLQDKREHEANCHYRTYKCIVSHCMWKGFRPDILGHMIEVHRKIVVYGENQILRLKLDTCVHFTQNWIVSAFGQVFRINFLVSYLRSQIAGCVQYLGPRKYAANYSYTFEVSTNNRKLLYSRHTHGDTGRLMTLYNTGDCFYLRTDAANYYVTDKVIKVILQIKKTDNAPEKP